MAQGGSAVFAFASVWLLTRAIGSEGYGGVVAIIAASQMVQIFVNWTSVSVVRFGVEEFVETGKISGAFWGRSLILLPNLFLILLLSPWWLPLVSHWLKLPPETHWLLLVHFTVTVVWLHVQQGLQGAKLPRWHGMLGAVERVLVFAILLSLFAFGGLTWINALWGYISAAGVMVLIGIWRLSPFLSFRFNADLSQLRSIILFSLPLIPFSIVGYLSGSYIDAIFILQYLSKAELGIYSVATQINGLTLQLPTLANALLIPLFVTLQTENKSHKKNAFFKEVLPSLTLGWGAFCTLMAFGGYFAIPLIFGRDFSGSVAPLWILFAASTTAFPVLAGFSAQSNSTSATYIAMIAAIASSAANVAADFLLIPSFGMEGCAWATVITFFVGTSCFVTILKIKQQIPVSWLFMAMLPGLSGAVCFSLSGNPWLSLLVCAVITILVIYLQFSSLKDTYYFIKGLRRT